MFKQAMQNLMEAQNMNAREPSEAVKAYSLVNEASVMLTELAKDPSTSAKQKQVQGRNLAKVQSAMKTLRGAHPAVEATAVAAEAAARGGAPTKRCRAVHAWNVDAGAGDGDLVFGAGDELELVSEEQPGHGWMTGRRAGVEGIFPGNYVEVFDAPVVAEDSATVSGSTAFLEDDDEEEPAPVVTRARSRTSGERENADDAAAVAAHAAGTVVWEGKDKQQRAAEEAKARRAAKHAGSTSPSPSPEADLDEAQAAKPERPRRDPKTPRPVEIPAGVGLPLELLPDVAEAAENGSDNEGEPPPGGETDAERRRAEVSSLKNDDSPFEPWWFSID